MFKFNPFTGKLDNVGLSLAFYDTRYINATGDTMTGDFAIRDNATETKGYRFRTSGSSLDVDFHGAALIFSGFDDTTGYTGTQRGKLVLKINEDTSQLVGNWECSNSIFGVAHHWLGSTTGLNQARFNDDQVDADTIIKGQTDANLLRADASTDRVGIRTGAPGETLDVKGNFQVKDADTATKEYRFRTSGSNLDVDFSGADAFISVFSAANYGGTQRNKLRLESGADINHAIGEWQFTDGPFGSSKIKLEGANGNMTNIGAVVNSAVVTVTATGTIAATTYMQRVDTASNTNQTLPTATAGKHLIVKNVNTGTVTLVGTVDGVVNPTLAVQYKYVHLLGNGTSWDIIGNN